MKSSAICVLVFCLGFCSQASGQGGIITTVAGNGNTGFSGDGGPATSAGLSGATGVAVDASGNIFIVEEQSGRFRKVSASGIIPIFAGGGSAGCNDGPATSASFFLPSGVALDAAGNLFIADRGDNRVCKVSASGAITTVAGNGNRGFSGDGGPATAASLAGPSSVALDASGNLFIGDAGNSRVRKVSAKWHHHNRRG